MKISKLHQSLLTIILITNLFIPPAYAADNPVLQWNQLALDTIKKTKIAPPIASRALAILHTAIFDAWASYDDKALGTRLGSTLRRPESERTQANKEKAISFAAYNVLKDLFPGEEQSFLGLISSLGYDQNDKSTDTATPSGIGNTVASELLTFRHDDNSNQLGDLNNSSAYSDYTGYMPVNTSSELNDPSKWQPLNSSGTDQKFLVPQWGMVIPFALTSGNEFSPSAPATYPSKRYTTQAREVLKLSAQLNDKTKSIVEYWADGGGTVTPPGHWNVIAQFVSRRDSHSLDDDVKMFFILANAVFDAGIAAWDAKITYDSVRPITAIRFLFKGKKIFAWGGTGEGTKLITGEDWNSYISTPPFAEYVSGHSTFSAAASETLKLFTGSDSYNDSVTISKGSSPIEAGITPKKDVTLSWKTFTEAANQAGISRRYGGIHFKDGDFEARKMGRKIGKAVFEKATAFIEGTAQ